MDNTETDRSHLEKFCSDIQDFYGLEASAEARKMFREDPNSDFGKVFERAKYVYSAKYLKSMMVLGNLRTNS